VASCVTRRDFIATTAAASAGVAGLLVNGHTRAANSRAAVVDTHMHVWANNPKRYPFPHPYKRGFTTDDVPHEATVEMLIKDMNQHHCTHAVLVQVIYHGWDNAYVLDCAKRYPARFKAHGLIDPRDPQVADKLQYWMDRGLHGMRFSPIYYQNGQHGGDGWLDAPETHRVWNVAERTGARFNFFIAPAQLSKLAKLVQAHPEVKITLDHLSQMNLGVDPEPQMKQLLSMAKYPNVFVKVSELTSVSKSGTYPFNDAYPYVERVYQAFGPDRLLFGTGYPGAARAAYKRPTLDKEVDLISNMPFLSASDREKLLGLNAMELWGFDA